MGKNPTRYSRTVKQIFADLCLFDHYNIEIILENHGGNCSQCSGDYCKIKSFPKFITILALCCHLDPQNALFEHFEQIYGDFCLFDHYNIEIILEDHGGDCSQCSGDYFERKFFPKFITLLAL